MKKFLKISAVVFALAAVISAFAFSIGATEVKNEYASYTDASGALKEADLATAIKEAGDGTTVTLLGDCTLLITATVDKNLTVDLGGYGVSTRASNLFNVTESVTFTVTGTGSINIPGALYKTAQDKTPTVSIVGTSGKGIAINQNATQSDPYIVHNYNGTYLFKNLDVVTTYSAATTRYKSFFHNDTATTSATVTFDTVEFDAPNAMPNDPGTFILGVCGADSKLYIKNSGLYTNASGIYLGHLVARDNVTADGVGIETVIAEITDSVISNGGKAHNKKSYGLFLEKEGFANTGAVGIINVKNSIVESAGRAVYASVANNSGQVQKVSSIVNFENSTLKGKMFTGSNSDFVLSRHTIINLDADSKVSSLKNDVNFANAYGYVMGAVGTRTNTLDSTTRQNGIKFPDGTYGTGSSTYTWLFDPMGDPEYPYVMVNKTDVPSVTPIKTTSVTFEAYYFKTATDLSGDTENLVSRSGIDTKSSTGYGLNMVQAATRSGSLYMADNGTNRYFRYVTTAHGPANVTVEGDKVYYSKKDSTASDSFYVMGGANTYNGNLAYFEDGSATVTVNNADTTFTHNRAKVVALSFDFGTDSDKGYTLVEFRLTSRFINSKTDTAKANEVSLFFIDNDGYVRTTDAFDKTVDSVLLNPVGEWNNLSVVVYTDPALNNGQGEAYYYLNGELIGTSIVNNGAKDHLFVQGIRINIGDGVNYKHNLGSSFCIDNVNYQVYGDYAVAGECDATTDAAGVYKPESYKMSAPVNTYIGNSTVSVSGVPYANTEDAFEKAEALGTNVELKRDFIGTVAANGSIYTCGHTLTPAEDSYGYNPDSEKVTFSEDYKYDVYWYVGEAGNAEQMDDLANYLKTEAKLGFAVDHDFVVDEAIDLDKLSVMMQVGWSKTGIGENETPFVATYADYELYANTTNARFYPVLDATVPLNFYVSDSTGSVIKGGMTSDEATAALLALADGDTFVMQNDLMLSDSFGGKYVANATVNIDLGGNTLFGNNSGVFIAAGNGAVVNVYSSLAGGSLAVNNMVAFVVNDGVDISTRSAADLAADRNSVDNAKINVGNVTVGEATYSGSNMNVVAKTLFKGYKGADNCSFTMDGSNFIATAGSYSIELYVYDGEANFKNGIIFSPSADNVLHAAGFSANSKYDGNRNSGFEDILITGLINLENVYILNKVSGYGDTSNNNVVGNNGDSSNLFPDSRTDKRIVLNNVVTTGRLNPANEGSRSLFKGFVAAEIYDVFGIENRIPEGYVQATAGVPMTWNMLELGIDGGVVEFKIPVISNGEIVSYTTYYIAEQGADTDGLGTVYTLPNFNFATGISESFVSVIFKDIDGATSLLEQYFVPGARYVAPATLPTPTSSISTDALKLVWDGNDWVGVPAADTVMTESAVITATSQVTHNLQGVETNFSVYSDIGVSLFIPIKYKEYVSVCVGGNVIEAVEYDTDGDEIADAVRFTVRQHVLDVANGVNFVITVTENENSAEAQVDINLAYYASKILANEEGDANDKLLAYYLVNYAVEAIKYFTDEAPDEALCTLLTDYSDIKTLPEVTFEASSEVQLGAAITEATVQLTYVPNYVFRLKDGFAGEISFVIGGAERSFTVGAEDSRILVVADVFAYNLTDSVTVTVSGTVGEEAVELEESWSYEAFAAYHVANAVNDESATKDSSADALALIKAIYDYATAASAYVAE